MAFLRASRFPGAGAAIQPAQGTAPGQPLASPHLVAQPDAGAVTADASGSLSLSGAASASVFVQGAASGALSLSGAATGSVAVVGAASGSLTLAGASSGAVAVQGAASGALSLAGVSTGSVGIVGSSAGLLTIASQSDSAVLVQADSAGALPMAGASTGTVADPLPEIVADASGSLTLSGTADGTVTDEAPGVGGIPGHRAKEYARGEDIATPHELAVHAHRASESTPEVTPDATPDVEAPVDVDAIVAAHDRERMAREIDALLERAVPDAPPSSFDVTARLDRLAAETPGLELAAPSFAPRAVSSQPEPASTPSFGLPVIPNDAATADAEFAEVAALVGVLVSVGML